jgi:hypothetical protein
MLRGGAADVSVCLRYGAVFAAEQWPISIRLYSYSKNQLLFLPHISMTVHKAVTSFTPTSKVTVYIWLFSKSHKG